MKWIKKSFFLVFLIDWEKIRLLYLNKSDFLNFFVDLCYIWYCEIYWLIYFEFLNEWKSIILY